MVDISVIAIVGLSTYFVLETAVVFSRRPRKLVMKTPLLLKLLALILAAVSMLVSLTVVVGTTALYLAAQMGLSLLFSVLILDMVISVVGALVSLSKPVQRILWLYLHTTDGRHSLSQSTN